MTFFASDPMLSSGWEQVSGPPGFYDPVANRTYVAWQFTGLAGYKGIHVAYYDHGTGTWSERYTAGNFLLANDDHGHPSLVRDEDGHIHCFFGSHVNKQKWSVTNNPDDISSWTQTTDLGYSLTYPQSLLVGSTLYLLVRESTTNTRRKLAYSTMTPAGGIGTWASLKNIVDFGTDSRVYTSEAHLRGNEIHICGAYTTFSDAKRKGVYYFVLDTTTGDIKNFDGSVTVPAANLPVTKAQSDADFRIYDHGSNDGDIASLQFDSSGNAHVLFADGVSPNYELKHITLSGGAWSSPVTVASVSDISPAFGYVGTYALVPGVTMEAWYNVGGDKMRRVLCPCGNWGAEETIQTAGAYPFVQASAIRDAHPDLRTVYSENSGGAIDANAANLALCAYGDSGPITATIAVVDDSAVLLLSANHRDGRKCIDTSKSSVVMTFYGNARVEDGWIRLDGAGDYLAAINNPAYSVADGSDFRIDGSLRRNDTGRLQCVIGKRAAGSSPGEFALYVNAANQLQFLMWNGANAVLNLIGSDTLTGDHSFEVSRAGGVISLFLDGVLQASGVASSNPTTNAQALLVGRDPSNTARDFNGWLRLRFTR